MRRHRTYDVVITRDVLGIEEKPRRRRRSRRGVAWRGIAWPRARILSAGLLVILLGTLGYLLTAPTYTVYGAAVRGNRLVDAETIFRASGVQGQNVFRLNTTAVVRAVEQLPYVKRARVWVRLPADVAIAVEEYQPRWVWVSGADRFWIDEAGNVLPYGGPLTDTLTVVDGSGQPLPVGERIQPDLVEMLWELGRLMPELEQVVYDPALGLILRTEQGWPVRIGRTPDRLRIKLAILQALVDELAQRGANVDFVDLRYPERPYYRLK
jgi:cell division protein FtsQ